MNITLIHFGEVVGAVGGGEKVLCNMANALSDRGHEVHIVCNNPKSGLPFFPLKEQVCFHNLKTPKPSWILKFLRESTKLIRKIPFFKALLDPLYAWKLKKTKQILPDLLSKIKPDIVILFRLQDALYVHYPKSYLPCPTILMLHIVPEDRGFLGQMNNQIIKDSFLQCDCLQVLMPSFKNRIQAQYSINTAVIPNAVPQFNDAECVDLLAAKPPFTILTIGRIVRSKHQHLLIEAFSLIAKEYPHWKVEIYGHGQNWYETRLHKLIRKNKLQDQVHICGTTKDVIGVLRQSDIFAFPSLSEGFPLALTEAMSIGLPCVGLQTCSTVNELIVDGINGLLAENNAHDFSAKLKLLMDDAELRSRLGKAGHETMKPYAPDNIWDQWETLISETVSNYKVARKVTP